LLLAAEGDFPQALTAFDQSVHALEGFTYPLERARTLLCHGAALRQAQQRAAAREALEHATAIFEELGGRLWADKARSELARISGRRAPSELLTGTEREVAALAGQGHSNKEIAASLHMGVSTVEAHLSSVYRKLDVRRAGLAARLAEV
jgi:DNA-binding CsgD family transcriptional regulator